MRNFIFLVYKVNNLLVKYTFFRIAKRILSKVLLKLEVFSNLKYINLDGLTVNKPVNLLMMNSIHGNPTILRFEKILKKVLKNLDINTLYLSCDGFLDACFECTHLSAKKIKSDRFTDKQFCFGCKKSNLLNKDNVIYYSELISADDQKAILNFKAEIKEIDDIDILSRIVVEGVNLGEHARAATIRFFAKSNLDADSSTVFALKAFLVAAEKTRIVTSNVINRFNPDVSILIHGLYVPHGIVGEVMRKNGIRTIIWNKGYRKNTYIFSNDDTYHKTLLHENREDFLEIKFDDDQQKWIKNYLKSRWYGKEDWITFVNNPKFNVTEKSKAYKLRVILLTNVTWDAQIHYDQNVFNSILEWIDLTISWFIKNSDYELIIRAHPAEVNSIYPSEEKIEDYIYKNYGSLPSNISVIKSNNPMSTYSLIESSDAALIYATKMGVEISPLGIPVIVCGEAWIKNKGLTLDVASRDHYIEVLNGIENVVNSFHYNQISLKYAFYFFHDVMMRFDFYKEVNAKELESNLRELIKGILEGRKIRSKFFRK